MQIDESLTLLGGLSPARFMRRHWQKKPLLVRQAVPQVEPPLGRAALFAMVTQDGVESRLVERTGTGWRLRPGPFTRRSLPPLARPGWTLLVQGLDLHVQAAHDLLARFRFVPDARLDDLMLSYASDGGGVGPHVDSYDVFLLQVLGRRRWRIGRQRDLRLQPDAPLKILQHFEPEAEWLLEPGDMLYLPPHWAHDGIAEGECMTASIGFRAGAQRELGRELLQALLDGDIEADGPGRRYADAAQPATAEPARIPLALRAFGAASVQALLADPTRLDRALGEVLSEPKPGVVFDGDGGDGGLPPGSYGLRLDRRTRMLHDDRHVYINGESYRAGGRDARLLQRLADQRALGPRELAALSPAAHDLVADWLQAGWLHADGQGEGR